MPRNPYTPPAAPVADAAGTEVGAEGSRDVLKANMLLWISFGLGVINFVLDAFRLVAQGSPMIAMVALAFGIGIGFLLNWWYTSKLKAGRNWMRIFLTACAILVVAASLLFWDFYRAFVVKQYGNSTAAIAIAVLQHCLWIVAIVFLHTKRSRDWFAAMNAAR
jgi:hypothetical protein